MRMERSRMRLVLIAGVIQRDFVLCFTDQLGA